jgi:hypothetical protein
VDAGKQKPAHAKGAGRSPGATCCVDRADDPPVSDEV